ncbi:ShlB/FhaC/HecB family hemolysin secretion/activation protein [Sporomusa malonica]|uniref:Hemolysin activation/secretion protein n=2 Tax=Sporomusa malonica TaxID=112901 RepID=A0A1W2DFH2_9FIRM|nr:Hemolysin activation/secretion protein [Sporomusa malonica]
MKDNFSNGKKQVITGFTILVLATCPAYAAGPPNSGTLLESIKPPATQQLEGKAPSITVAGQQPLPQEDSGQKIQVNDFRLSGEPPLPAADLLKLVKSQAGKETTLGELNALAARVTQYLRQQGYLVAFAYIPAQDIVGGVVEIAVIPGKYGQTKITGTAHIDPARLQGMLFAAKPGMIITREPLERALLLINDLAGVSVKATLTPGETAGTADLVLEAADTAKTSGAFYADNWGNRYTGQTRYGVQLTVNNFSNTGDNFSLGGLTTGQGINNYNLGYSSLIGNDGAKFEIKYSHVGYTLGDTFADLGATGRAAITSYGVSYPLIRSRAFSLYGTFGVDKKHLRDDITSTSSHSPKDSSLWNLGLSGNFADNWGGGGTNAFGLTHYQGKLTIKDATALANDTYNTAGDFSKTVFSYQRQQYVAKNLNFNFNFIGQLADKNLDSSEKLYLGGADGVRAFPQGEASGDEGYKLTGELRWRLDKYSTATNSLYLNGFYDYGSVIINKNPVGSGDNRRSLAGAGLGLMWTREQNFAVRMDYAWKIGQATATADTDKNGRLWLQGVKYF